MKLFKEANNVQEALDFGKELFNLAYEKEDKNYHPLRSPSFYFSEVKLPKEVNVEAFDCWAPNFSEPVNEFRLCYDLYDGSFFLCAKVDGEFNDEYLVEPDTVEDLYDEDRDAFNRVVCEVYFNLIKKSI